MTRGAPSSRPTGDHDGIPWYIRLIREQAQHEHDKTSTLTAKENLDYEFESIKQVVDAFSLTK
jgi:hypothetical protein